MKREDYINWDEYFMGIALLTAMRSKDPNSQVGACIVSPENKILSLGYNGMPIGCSDDEMPWEREGDPLDTKYMYVCHAELNAILKKYDEGGMLIGEAPCTKDLINCTDRDFKVVSVISIAAIFVIIALVLKSFSLPILLVAMIELAIALNLCIPYFTGTTLPFVGPILISTIQLGATVDYAILMTTRYKQGRMAGKEKKVAVGEAVAASAQSILVSGVSFFASTFGVGLYSNVDIISSMCSLIARGALCSVAVVLFLLPAMLLLCDGFIVRTTVGMKKKA